MNMCKIEGCNRIATYIDQCVCQKHYFRYMRNGTYELKRKRKLRIQNPAGYYSLYIPEHPLSSLNGYVYEHRKIIYDTYGQCLPCCQMCGKEITWANCHIDHIDCDVTNNTESNLRPTCNACNTRRHYPPLHECKNNIPISCRGFTMTSSEWSRREDVFVNGHTIRRRIKRGIPPEIAIFTPATKLPREYKKTVKSKEQ